MERGSIDATCRLDYLDLRTVQRFLVDHARPLAATPIFDSSRQFLVLVPNDTNWPGRTSYLERLLGWDS
jgi:hypothetical protein